MIAAAIFLVLVAGSGFLWVRQRRIELGKVDEQTIRRLQAEQAYEALEECDRAFDQAAESRGQVVEIDRWLVDQRAWRERYTRVPRWRQ